MILPNAIRVGWSREGLLVSETMVEAPVRTSNAWNKFQSQNGGKHLTSQALSKSYHEKKNRPLRFWGVVLPKGNPEAAPHDVDDFTPREVRDLRLEKLDILVEHNSPPVGRIDYSWVGDKSGQKYVVGSIHRDSLLSLHTGNRIETRALRGLSLTHRFQMFMNPSDGRLQHTKDPMEVSVCREGRRMNCFILGHWEEAPHEESPPRASQGEGGVSPSSYKYPLVGEVSASMSALSADASPMNASSEPAVPAPTAQAKGPEASMSPVEMAPTTEVIQELIRKEQENQRLAVENQELRTFYEQHQKQMESYKQGIESQLQEELNALQKTFQDQFKDRLKESMMPMAPDAIVDGVLNHVKSTNNLDFLTNMLNLTQGVVCASKQMKAENEALQKKIQEWEQTSKEWQKAGDYYKKYVSKTQSVVGASSLPHSDAASSLPSPAAPSPSPSTLKVPVTRNASFFHPSMLYRTQYTAPAALATSAAPPPVAVGTVEASRTAPTPVTMAPPPVHYSSDEVEWKPAFLDVLGKRSSVSGKFDDTYDSVDPNPASLYKRTRLEKVESE